MSPVRHALAAKRAWLLLLLACTLFARLAVPSGFMPVLEGGRVTLQHCPGVGMAETHATAMPGMAMPGMVMADMVMADMDHGAPDHPDTPGKVEPPCAFAGLGMPALAGTDPALLIAAILFAFVLAVRAIAQLPPPAPGRLRPPLRAPPLGT